MSGHNALAELGADQVGAANFEGKFILVKGSAPGSSDKGYGKGALCVNTAGDSTSTHWYVNLGTAASPTWTALTIA